MQLRIRNIRRHRFNRRLLERRPMPRPRRTVTPISTRPILARLTRPTVQPIRQPLLEFLPRHQRIVESHPATIEHLFDKVNPSLRVAEGKSHVTGGRVLGNHLRVCRVDPKSVDDHRYLVNHTDK